VTLDDLLWSKVSAHLFCTKEQYLRSIDKFSKAVIEKDGHLVGVVLTCGPEIHVAWVDGKQGTRALLREHLGGLIKTYGYATTSVPRSRKASQDFVVRLGFEQTHENEFDIYYRIERMRHAPKGI